MRKKLSTILLFVILLAGLGIMLYPMVSDYWNSFHASRAIAGYAESISQIDEDTFREMLTAANEYNAGLAAKGNPWQISPEELETYEGLLNYTGNGIMGYIEIPKISCALPIYHGTSEAVLQIAVGHIEGSSLPVGGPSTHAVLSGHRGLPSAKLFSDLDELSEGDIFMLQVLNEVLTYEVDQIRTVLPTEMDDLRIAQGRDFCTLVTCTPYGINSHRMLVRGHRIENLETAGSVRVTAEAMRIDPIIVAPIAAVPMLIMLMLWMLASTGRSAKRSSVKKKIVESAAKDAEEKGGKSP